MADLDDDGLMLPPLDDRRWLLDEVAALVTARGPAPLLTALLVEPNPRYFPDRWGGGEASVRRLIRRLCGYAGLPDRTVHVTVHDAEPTRRGEVTGKPAPARGHQELSAWLVSLTATDLKIGVESAALADPAAFVAAAARVVAHAWRGAHGLPIKDAYDPRIDVTAVYLGFALLTADAALRFTSRTAAGAVANRRTPLRVGSLPPQAVCFLLAAQAHVRGLPAADRTRIGKGLQANQAAYFRHAYAAIERMEPALAAQWHIPPREHWPAAPALATLTAALPGEQDDDAEARRDEDPGVAGLNRGKPVFMIDRSMAPRLGRVLFMGVLMLGGVVSGMSPNRSGASMGIVAASALILGLLGLAIGRLVRDRRCSEPKCSGPLKPTDLTCPRCSGTVAGTIAHPRERLAAEEALLRAQASTAIPPTADPPPADPPPADPPAPQARELQRDRPDVSVRE